MSALAKSSRKAMQEKAKRLASADPHQKVDSSTWSPAEPLDADVKTGARPLVKRLYKSGGKVHGMVAKKRADRTARKSGGRTGEAADRSKRYLTPDNLINRDVRMANEAREGKKHIGAFKKGGRTKHADGMAADGDVIGDMIRKEMGRSTYTPPADLETPARPTRRSADSILESGKAYQQMIEDELARRAAAAAAAKAKARKIYETTGGMGGMGLKKGGKVSEMEWEHSKKDLAEDKKLAKKHGMSLEKWEKSALDKKHDKQQSTKGLCYGGKAKKAGGGMLEASKKAMLVAADPHMKGAKKMTPEPVQKPEDQKKAKGGSVFSGNSTTKVPGVVGGRKAHKKGGKTKGKTHININVMPQSAAPMPMPMGGPMMPPPRPPMAPPMAPPAGGPPMGAPPMGGGGPQIPPAFLGGGAGGPPRPMMRKSGGRTTHVIKHAAGGGLGRLEKIKAYGEPQKGLK